MEKEEREYFEKIDGFLNSRNFPPKFKEVNWKKFKEFQKEKSFESSLFLNSGCDYLVE